MMDPLLFRNVHVNFIRMQSPKKMAANSESFWIKFSLGEFYTKYLLPARVTLVSILPAVDVHVAIISVPGPEGQPDGGYSMMMFLMGWIVVATALFLLRPSSLRNRGDQKPSRPGVGRNLILSFMLYTKLFAHYWRELGLTTQHVCSIV